MSGREQAAGWGNGERPPSREGGGRHSRGPIDEPAPAYRDLSSRHVRAPRERRRVEHGGGGPLLGANGVGAIVAVAAVALAALFFEYRAGAAPATPSPTTTASPTATASATATATATVSLPPGVEALVPVPTPVGPLPVGPLPVGPLPVAVSSALRLPFAVDAPQPDLPVDDGRSLYLTGAGRVTALDLATDRVQRVPGSEAFPSGTRRLLVDDGVWASAWPGSGGVCDAACWSSATTVRVDSMTGGLSLTLRGRYLVGGDAYELPPEATDGGRLRVFAAANAFWILSGDELLRLDFTAAVPG